MKIQRAAKRDAATGGPKGLTAPAMGLVAAAAVVTSLRGLPTMAKEELTMFAYIAFATVLFLIPASLVSAEMGGAFADRKGGVYAWIGEAFGQRFGFLAVWLQWSQNLVWYPTGLGFGAAAVAFVLDDRGLAGNNKFVGVFCIVAYWVATLVALSGTTLLVKVAKYGFVAGTVVPGLVLLGLFVYWIATGHSLGWDHAHSSAVTAHGHGHTHNHPRLFPFITDLGGLAFLASIILLFAGPEVQASHVTEMRDPRRGFPRAMLLAALISFTIFTLGSLAIAGILPYDAINLQSGVFDAFHRVLDGALGVGWLVPVISVLICYGALSGALAWIDGPSKALLTTAEDGHLPPFLQRTNSRGAQRNILLVQGVIVTLISCIYLVTDDVSSAFFLISAMTVSLYIVMYLLMYAAAIRLRYSRPDLKRPFRIPGGLAGMWCVAGIGFLAVGFALVLSFVPPTQLPINSPVLYTVMVATGLIVFTAIPLLLSTFAKPSWRRGS